MKICICCSLTFTREVEEIGKMLEVMGHEVLLPNGVINHLIDEANFDPVQAKINTNSNRLHVDKIRESDAVLVCNFIKDCTPGYIGANTFAEMFAANYLGKQIFTLFPLPENAYIEDELRSFQITVLNNDLNLIPVNSMAGNYYTNSSSNLAVEPAAEREVALEEPAARADSVVTAAKEPSAPERIIAMPQPEDKPLGTSATPEATMTVPNVPSVEDSSAPTPPIDANGIPAVPSEPATISSQPAVSGKSFLKQARDNWVAFWGKTA